MPFNNKKGQPIIGHDEPQQIDILLIDKFLNIGIYMNEILEKPDKKNIERIYFPELCTNRLN